MSAFKEFFKTYIKPISCKVDWINVTPATYVRWILAFVACINSFLNMIGKNPLNVDENQLYNVVSNVLTIAIMMVNTYNNNSTSSIAIEHDKQIKAEKLAAKEANKLNQ